MFQQMAHTQVHKDSSKRAPWIEKQNKTREHVKLERKNSGVTVEELERKEWRTDLIKHTVYTYEILNTIPLLKKLMWRKLSLSHKGRLKVQIVLGNFKSISKKKAKRLDMNFIWTFCLLY